MSYQELSFSIDSTRSRLHGDVESPAPSSTPQSIPRASATPSATLLCLFGVGGPEQFELRSNRVFIGMTADADLRLPGSSPRAVRAVLERVSVQGSFARQWAIRDLASEAGVYVGRRRLTRGASLPLVHGAIVRLGDWIFQFVEREVTRYSETAANECVAGGPIGGWQIERLVGALTKIAPTAMSVLLVGETGTGKETFARHVHETSGRTGRFVVIRCMPGLQNQLETELFGSEGNEGALTQARGGTLVLDDVAELPAETQAKLLHILNTDGGPDVRLIATAHDNLRKRVAEGTLRGDLYSRIAEMTIVLPPLRTRREDLALLVPALLKRHGSTNMSVSVNFFHALACHAFPFNVRELESVLRQAVAFSRGAVLDVDSLPAELVSGEEIYEPATEVVGRPTEAQMRQLLTTHRGNVAAVGRALGKARIQIHRWLKRYNLDAASFRGPGDSGEDDVLDTEANEVA
ncbi:MAG: sigma 54-interacting transcriptional regulator [Polyangiaceae bacterium]